jgi:hypothetical protein
MDPEHPLFRSKANYYDHGLSGYRTFFSHAAVTHKVVFEATTHYLYQRTALEVLSGIDPVPEIMLILRKPEERVYSSFQYTKNNLANLRHDISFARFTEMVMNGATASTKQLFASHSSAFILQHDIQYSQYVDYVEPWIRRFGREHVRVFPLDQIKQNPAAFMKGLAEHLDIEGVFYDTYDFQRKNETISIRNKRLHRVYRQLTGLFPDALNRALRPAYEKLQIRASETKTEEDLEVLEKLSAHFAPYNNRLSRLLDLDLSGWK